MEYVPTLTAAFAVATFAVSGQITRALVSHSGALAQSLPNWTYVVYLITWAGLLSSVFWIFHALPWEWAIGLCIGSLFAGGIISAALRIGVPLVYLVPMKSLVIDPLTIITGALPWAF